MHTFRSSKPVPFHPIEELTKGQLKAREAYNVLVEKASEKGLRITRCSFGVGFYVFYPDGKRTRFTSYRKLEIHVQTYTKPVAA